MSDSANEIIDEFVVEFGRDIQTVLDDINSQPQRTQNRYDQYMRAIWEGSKGDKRVAMLMGIVMAKKGGDKRGIIAALRAMGVI